MTSDSFGAHGTLTVGDRQYQVWQLATLADIGDITRLPYSIKILLENLVHHENGRNVTT